MRVSFFGVMVLWVVILGLAAPGPSSGSETGIEITDKVKADDTEKSSKTDTGLKKTKRSAKEDRPWIIKEHVNKKSDTPKKKPAPLKWKNDAQQLQCETLLKKLQKSLGKARTYSIRGDTCATARHAKGFMDLADRCHKDCPDGFLRSNGYSEKIIQNVKVLSELGKKACLDK